MNDNNGFIGKQKPLKILQKEPTFIEVFSQFGENWRLDSEAMNVLEKFVCSIYGYPKQSDIDDVRLQILKRK